MKSLARWFVAEICKQIEQSASNKVLICLNCIDNAEIYCDICSTLQSYADKNDIQMTAKLAKKKYEEFNDKSEDKPYAQMLQNHGWIDFEDKMTYYRNQFLDRSDKTYLVLLMGTEAVEDKGGLADFYVLNPQKADRQIKDSYDKLIPQDFQDSLVNRDTFIAAFNAFYKLLFQYIEKDLLRLSNQIDEWIGHGLEEQEIWDNMFLTLPNVWRVPKIVDAIPSYSAVTKNGKKLDILEKACAFIQRKKYAKLSSSERKKLIKQFDLYKSSDKADKYYPDLPNQNTIKTYHELQQTVLDFASNVAVQENRQKLLDTDFSIVEAILKTKIPKVKVKAKTQKIYGDPLTVLLTAYLSTATYPNSKDTDYNYKKDIYNRVVFKFEKVEVGLKGISDTDKSAQCAKQWRKICRSAGGVIEFIQCEGWQFEDDDIQIIYTPANIFDPKESDSLVADGFITSKITENTKIPFSVSLYYHNQDDNSDDDLIFTADYEWNIRSDEDWLIAFSRIKPESSADVSCEDIPYFVWPEINNVFRVKSKEEFVKCFSQAKLERKNLISISQQLIRANPQEYVDERFAFQKLGKAFSDFAEEIEESGFYHAIFHTAPNLIQEYLKTGKIYVGKGVTIPRMQFLRCFGNAFLIAKDMRPINADIMVSQCIVPPYHPAMLEKMVDRMVFLRAGAREWYEKAVKSSTEEKLTEALARLMDLSYVHAGIDAVLTDSDGTERLIGVNQTYGYFSLYGEYHVSEHFTRMGVMLEKEAIYDDDFSDTAFNHISAEAKMIIRVMDSYRDTYGKEDERFTLTFVNPLDLQVIVSAITGYVKELKTRTKNVGQVPVFIDVKVLQSDKNKGGRNYLSYWLNNMLDVDAGIHIETYLQYWHNHADITKNIQGNTDIVFFMDALREQGKSQLNFTKADYSVKTQKLACRYPMVFRPQVNFSSAVSRSVDVTQPQFEAAMTHTQVLSYYKTRDAENINKIYCTENINVEMQKEIQKAHKKAVWVVCIDQAIDKACIRAIYGDEECPVIGFSTGEGSFGQLNLTITTRSTVGVDIKERCKRRLRAIFSTWTDSELEKASDVCLKRSPRLDGVSVLQALNPSAYEINNFLAYLMLDYICEQKQKKIVLIRLDSYRHWFDEKYSTVIARSDEKRIPDFLVIRSVDKPDGGLHLIATVIECKIAKECHTKVHLDKAKSQVVEGLKVLQEHFDPDSKAVESRYWLAQLYRAITFGNYEQNELEKLGNLIDGQFTIEWHGAVYGFWFDRMKDGEDVYLDYQDGTEIEIHEVAQGGIQRILLNKSAEDSIQLVDQIGAIEKEDEEEWIAAEEDAAFENGEFIIAEAEKSNIDVVTTVPVLQPTDRLEKSLTPPSNEDVQQREAKQKTQTDPVQIISEDLLEKRTPVQEKIGENVVPLEDIRVLIGQDRRTNNVYWEFGNKQLSNRHILITGSSGQGKTYCIQAMLLELSRQGISSVIFDYTDGFLPGRLEPEFENELQGKIIQKVALINKIPVNPFLQQQMDIPGIGSYKEGSQITAGRLADILCHVYHFGSQQRAALYSACREGIEKYHEQMDFSKMRMLLEHSDAKEAKTVLSAMQQFLDSDLFDTTSAFDWQNVTKRDGKVTVIQLTGLDRTLQTILTEITLWDAWYSLVKFGKKDTPFIVVLDEAQNLSFQDNSPAVKILREGRKYGWSAWFATQFLKGALDSGEISNLQQAAERIYFKPSGEEMTYVAGQIADDRAEASDWYNTLKAMVKGQCVVQGDRIKANGQFGAVQPTLVKVTSIGER